MKPGHTKTLWVACRAVVVAALVSVAGCGGPHAQDGPAAARAAMDRRDFNAAAIHLKSALQGKPNDPELRLLLGSVLLEQGQVAAALVEFKKASDAGSVNDALVAKTARAMVGAGKSAEVIDQYQSTQLADPRAQAELATAVAFAYMQRQQFDAARVQVEKALGADPTFNWALLARARLLAGAGEYQEALKFIDRAMVESQPNGEALLLRAGILRLGLNDPAAAITALQSAALDPRTELMARASLVQLFHGQRDLQSAQRELAQLQKNHSKHPVTGYMAGVVAFAAKDYAQAESISEQLLKLFPGNPQVLVLGGAASLGRGALLAAESKLGRVVQTVEGMPVARRLLAETYIRMGQPDKALVVLKPLLDGKGSDADAWTMAGNAHLLSGKLTEAESAYRIALKTKPELVSSRVGLALAQMNRGSPSAGLDALETVAASTEDETAELALIGSALSLGDHARALVAVERLRSRQPASHQAEFLKGLVLRAMGDRGAARASFESALKLQPGHVAATTAIVWLDVADLQLDRALGRVEQALAKNQASGQLWRLKFRLAEIQGQADDRRLKLLDDAIRAAPYDAGLRVLKLAHLGRTGRLKDAAAFAGASIAAMPGDPGVLEAGGAALAAAGDEQQAISTLNRLISLVPASAAPYLQLAAVHAKRGNQAARLSSLSRGIDVDPHSIELHAALVDAASATRDFATVLAMARKLQGDFPAATSGYMLEGDVAAARKRWADAVAAYRKALGRPRAGGIEAMRLYAALVASGDTGAAEAFAAEQLRLRPGDPHLLAGLAAQALIQKRYPVAERHYAALVKLQPDSSSALNNLAWLMAERGASGSVAMAERAMASAYGSPAVLDTLAKALAAEGQIEKALSAQRMAAAALPERQEYRLNLVRLLLKAGQREQARDELKALEGLGDRLRHRVELEDLRRQAGA